MSTSIQDILVPAIAFLIPAIGLLIREIHYRRKAKRQAAHDSSVILKERKTLLEEMIPKAHDSTSKETLQTQLDEVNALLLGLYSERLRHTLREAGLPPEEALVADGRSRLQPEEATRLEASIEELKALPPSLSSKDLMVLGNAYYHMEQYQEAKNIYDKILDLNPNDPTTLNNRGVTYDDLERYDESLADYNRSLELRPDDPDTLTNRGVTYRHLERYDESLADYNRSLEIKPDDPDTIKKLATK